MTGCFLPALKLRNTNHWFNLFLDGNGAKVANNPETPETFMTDTLRDFPSYLSYDFIYADNNEPLAENDLVFENRILDRERDMEELVGEINLTKSIDIHNITVGTFMANTKALDNNWIHKVLGDYSNSPRAVSVSYLTADSVNVVHSDAGFISGGQTSNKTLQSSKIAIYAADEIKVVSLEKGVGSNNFSKASVNASDVAIALAGLYKLNSNLNLYANFSRGYFFPQLRTLKFNDNGVVQAYETEKVIQGELGVKFGADQLAGTAAVFFNNLTDRRNVDFINDGAGGIIEEVSLQNTQAFGVEASLNYNVTKGLNLFGNFTFQDHQLTKVEGNPEQEGNSIARIPNVMGMIGVNYDNSGFDVNATANILGNKFANNSNSVELEGFNIVRLDAGYTFNLGDSDEKLRLGFSVFNLLDSAGITEGSPRQGNAQGAAGEFFVGRPILPRRLFIKAAFDF